MELSNAQIAEIRARSQNPNTDVWDLFADLEALLEHVDAIKAQGWRSIDERPPEGAMFVAHDGTEYAIGYQNWLFSLGDDVGVFLPGRFGRGFKVKHWLPIPKKED